MPVISTTIGAEGLAACDGESVLLGDTAEAFADRCVDILEDTGLRRRLALAGYEHGRSKFDWSIANRAIDPVLAGVSSANGTVDRQGGFQPVLRSSKKWTTRP